MRRPEQAVAEAWPRHLSPFSPECIQEATSEFISFITSEAADRATSEKRKTITGDDILNALKTLGFDEMSEVLLIYLAKYREVSIILPVDPVDHPFCKT